MHSPTKNIKLAQKEATLLRLISQLFLEVGLDNSDLRSLIITRVKLSPDGSLCTVYFYSSLGQQEYDRLKDVIKLYKPSLRKAVAEKAALRHTPDFRFHFDEHIDKQKHIEDIFESLKKEIS